ncbi:glycoside hydrolase domain-containing protein [Kitasatospora griseola]|uniref:glycoside hydrolase domain-containing protein n=1 Tax=Kitasatospora griseola TaxID=2064 RepID=UPI00382C3ED9
MGRLWRTAARVGLVLLAVAGTGGGRTAGAAQRPAVDPRPVRAVAPGLPVPSQLAREAAAGHQLRTRLAAAGPAVLGADGPDRVRWIPGTAAATDAREAPEVVDEQADAGQVGAPDEGPRTDVAGLAFDRCAAPSDGAMHTWAASSPYQAVGVYIGGPVQACAAPGRDWVDARAAEGWAFLPIYVGRQAARGNLLVAADPDTARRQGADAADDAVRKAEDLGFRPGAVLYNDMENYDGDQYRDRVLAHLAGWTEQLHARGYRSGVYTGASSGVQDLAARWDDASYPQPDVLWAADWNSHHDATDTGMGLPEGAGYFTGGRRAHQYSGDTAEEYGGSRMVVDASYVDATSPAGDDGRLSAGRRLDPGRSIRSGTVALTMQEDGDLTLRQRDDGRLLWSSRTGGHPGAYAVQQDDGNLVVYDVREGGPWAGAALWSTGTWNSPGAYAVLQDDGNFVLYRRGGGPATGGAVWATGTSVRSG